MSVCEHNPYCPGEGPEHDAGVPLLDVSSDLFLPTESEEMAELRADYVKAIAIIRQVRRFARECARSGNPGRRDAGTRILEFLEVNS